MGNCIVCNQDSVTILRENPYCARHYVENEETECLHAYALTFSEEVKKGQADEKAKRIFTEILKRYPNILSRENEFGEYLTEDELADITERIRKLSPERMDMLWHRCGYIYANHEENYKALRKTDIETILRDAESAREKVWSLIAESHLDEVKKALAELEG